MSNHQELADFIKAVHIELRLSSRQVGPETAWEEHCNKNDTLQKYSCAMRDLATLHWDKNNEDNPNLNRIFWVVRECNNFYFQNGRKSALQREQQMYNKFLNKELKLEIETVMPPLKLLDVGSCYNPFKKFNLFDVTALDIAPATESVIKCDFLAAEIGTCSYLPLSSFDVVLFSFLLEYLPHSKMRFESCSKAYALLKPGGILIILTPDSKHDTANSLIMKYWRHALASLGFIRTNYQKLKHLRCMTFYKCFEPQAAIKWLASQNELNLPPEDSILIPQDNNSYETFNATENACEERDEIDNNILAEAFFDMAGTDVFTE